MRERCSLAIARQRRAKRMILRVRKTLRSGAVFSSGPKALTKYACASVSVGREEEDGLVPDPGPSPLMGEAERFRRRRGSRRADGEPVPSSEPATAEVWWRPP